jgi:hypothetical protein
MITFTEFFEANMAQTDLAQNNQQDFAQFLNRHQQPNSGVDPDFERSVAEALYDVIHEKSPVGTVMAAHFARNHAKTITSEIQAMANAVNRRLNLNKNQGQE